MQVEFRSARPALARIAWVWTAVLVAGCAGSLDELPSKNVDLTGDWKLNASLSDDTRKLLQAHFKTMSERLDRMPSQESGPMRRPTEGMTQRTSVEDSAEADRDPGGLRKLRKQREERFTSMVEAPERMEISLNGTRFIVKHGETRDEYRAGEKSVVSFGRGVADRTAGWRGKEFIVATRGLDGGSKEERFSLDSQGRLSVVMRLSDDRLPTLEIKRVYERNKF